MRKLILSKEIKEGNFSKKREFIYGYSGNEEDVDIAIKKMLSDFITTEEWQKEVSCICHNLISENLLEYVPKEFMDKYDFCLIESALICN